MLVRLDCGCYINDSVKSTYHDDTPARSTGDVEMKRHHYPIHLPSRLYCGMCDLHRPCMCDTKAAP